MLFYVICSSPTCDFSAQDPHFNVKGCPYCGSDVIHECPHCNHTLAFKGQIFCSVCKQRLKPEADQEA